MLSVLVLVSALLWTGGAAGATESAGKGSRSTSGLEAAQAISTITGVAISPLLGVSGVGAYKYFKTSPEKRAQLAWYAQPWFWAPALLLVALVFVKDTFGAALPTAVKKPFDVAEAIENKISALVVAGAFIPLVAAIFKATGEDTTWLDNAGLAMVAPAALLNVLIVPFAIAAFVVVFLVSHVINVLILVSPFTTVDAALKGARMALLSSVAVTSFANPYVGAAWSLVIVLICWFLAGWSFRLFVFGWVFTWDLGTFRKTRFKLDPEANWAFTACQMEKTPIRTYGKLSRGPQGELQLSYRPWLFLPSRTLQLPPGKYAVGRGLFYSEIVRNEDEDNSAVITLPPRYRSHEEELSSIYLLRGVQDAGMIKGMKMCWQWFRELFGFRPALAGAA